MKGWNSDVKTCESFTLPFLAKQHLDKLLTWLPKKLRLMIHLSLQVVWLAKVLRLMTHVSLRKWLGCLICQTSDTSNLVTNKLFSCQELWLPDPFVNYQLVRVMTHLPL
uniref:Uncharacterized protein n=1 Tax=Sclerotinia borealis TaxID=77105 RepID=A0A088CR50_9HELO|nr:hypothetical protein SBORM_0129 [Sclerotinia borealis]AIJ56822.1 hypothetical protein SBORM_0129 [Sclerotinia borealis]